jgi:hypothetical protein
MVLHGFPGAATDRTVQERNCEPAVLDICPIMRVRVNRSRVRPYAEIGDEPMKRAVRIVILMTGLVGTFVAATVQQVPAADGGPILLCPPKTPNCQTGLPLK